MIPKRLEHKSTLTLPADLLPGRFLDADRTALFTADGGCMAPVIQDGDRLVCEFGAQLEPGIFLFEFDGRGLLYVSIFEFPRIQGHALFGGSHGNQKHSFRH